MCVRERERERERKREREGGKERERTSCLSPLSIPTPTVLPTGHVAKVGGDALEDDTVQHDGRPNDSGPSSNGSFSRIEVRVHDLLLQLSQNFSESYMQHRVAHIGLKVDCKNF